MLLTSSQRVVELAAKRIEPAAHLGQLARLIGQVVGDAQEGVEGAHGPVLASRQEAKGVMEVACLRPRNLFAAGIGSAEEWGHGGASQDRGAETPPHRTAQQSYLLELRKHRPLPPDIVANRLDLPQNSQPAADKQLDVRPQLRRHALDE